MRYDIEKGVYQDCRFCRGSGCIACEAEASKAYQKEFSDGPKPIATFKLDSPKDMERLGKAMGRDALNKAFDFGNDGFEEIIENLRKDSKQCPTS